MSRKSKHMTQANHSSAGNASIDVDEEVELQDEETDLAQSNKTHRPIVEIKPEWLRARKAELAAIAAGTAAKTALDAAHADAAIRAVEREALENEIGQGQHARARAKAPIAMEDGNLYKLRKTRNGPYVLDAVGDVD
jgi:hypothetical protein